MKALRINKLAVLLCVLVAMLCSYGWYSLFSESWLSGNQLTNDFVEENRTSGPYAIAIIANLISFYIMAWLFIRLNVRSAARGVLMGLLMGIAFYFVVQYANNAFAFRPKELSLIDGGGVLINWMIGGAILGAWTKFKSNKNDA